MAIRELELKASSNVQSAGWDDETLRLHVQFHGGSRGYYSGVPSEEAEDFERADSPGSYVHSYLKTRYPWVRE
jgi:KTSC domain